MATSKFTQVNALHGELERGLRNSIGQALRIGELLADIKRSCRHGEWCDLFGKQIAFSLPSGERYIGLFRHRSKIVTLTNLHEAYAKVRAIESADRQEERRRRNLLVDQRDRTGVIPPGWDRNCDYEHRKRKAFGKGIPFFATDPKVKVPWEGKVVSLLESASKREGRRHAYYRGNGNKAIVLTELVDGVLALLDDDSERLAVCNEIIKHCRALAVRYQRECVASSS